MAVQPSVDTWAVFFVFFSYAYFSCIGLHTTPPLCCSPRACIAKIKFSVVIPDNLFIRYDWNTKVLGPKNSP